MKRKYCGGTFSNVHSVNSENLFFFISQRSELWLVSNSKNVSVVNILDSIFNRFSKVAK